MDVDEDVQKDEVVHAVYHSQYGTQVVKVIYTSCICNEKIMHNARHYLLLKLELTVTIRVETHSYYKY